LDEKKSARIRSLIKELCALSQETSSENASAATPSSRSLPPSSRRHLKDIESALLAIGSPALPELIALLKQQEFPSSVRAAEILGRIGDPEALPALAEALLHEDLGGTAYEVLQRFGPSAIPHIIGVVRPAVNPSPGEKIPPERYLLHALTTLGAIRCRFKISLRGIRPAPWRRLLIPESCSFYDLYSAIQDALGGMDRAFHHFEVPAAGRIPEEIESQGRNGTRSEGTQSDKEPSESGALRIECP
jgi:hypothetical protein